MSGAAEGTISEMQKIAEAEGMDKAHSSGDATTADAAGTDRGTALEPPTSEGRFDTAVGSDPTGDSDSDIREESDLNADRVEDGEAREDTRPEATASDDPPAGETTEEESTDSGSSTESPDTAEPDETPESPQEKGRKAIAKRAQEAFDKFSAVPENEREEWLNNPENADEVKLMDIQSFSNIDGVFFQKRPDAIFIGEAKGESRILITHEGRKLSITGITGASEDGTTFTCKAKVLDKWGDPIKDTDGNIEERTFESVPKQGVVDAMILDASAAISATLSPDDQLAFAEVVAEIPPVELLKMVDLTAGFTADNYMDRIREHEAKIKDNKKEKSKFKKQLDKLLDEKARELGKKRRSLTTEEQAEAVQGVVKDLMVDEVKNGHLSNEEQQLLETMRTRWKSENPEKKISQHELDQMESDIISARVKTQTNLRLNNEKYIAELRKKYGWKDILGLLVVLTQEIGGPVVGDMSGGVAGGGQRH